jgi:radical SAM superfamily enzyme YgiQ (UPF0313 family)
MAVDFLILAADSSMGGDYHASYKKVKEDVRAINAHLYELHIHLGMRVLGPSKIAWIARKHGYTSQVLSKLQMLTAQEILTLCEGFVNEKTIIGISTSLLGYPHGDFSTQSFHDSNLQDESAIHKLIHTIDHFREKYKTKIIVGGSQAVAFQDIFEADYMLQGEAENTLPQLLDKIKRSGIQKQPYDWQITTCDFKWHDTDCIVPREPVPLETSRGCIFRCRFCQFANIGKKIGTFERPLENIKEEICNNYEKYQTTHYWLADDTFNDNDERVNQFCEMLESLPFRINLMGYIRLDLAHRYQKTTQRLLNAGLVGCSFGIESFHPQAANAVGKAFSAKYAKEFLDHFYFDMAKENVMINCCNIVGLPGEGIKDLEKTLDWYSKRRHIHMNWSALTLYDPSRSKKEQEKSIFEKEASKYGYVFFEDKPINYWESPTMNWDMAVTIRNRITRKMKNHNIEAGEPWLNMHYLSILGITPKEARARYQNWEKLYLQETRKIIDHNSQYFNFIKWKYT